MSHTTPIQWCDSTVNPIMGCAGCELFLGPGAILRAIDDCLPVSSKFDWKFLLRTIVENRFGEIKQPVQGHTAELCTTNIFELRKVFSRQMGTLYDDQVAAAVLHAIESSVTCYAAKDHVKKGASIINPDRSPKKGFAPRFELVTPFSGRMEVMARSSDLLGKSDKRDPWIGGLPRLIFVSDMGDAFSRVEDFDFLEKEIGESIPTEWGVRHLWLWLTKRPTLMARFSERAGGFPPNVCAMTSVTGLSTLSRVDQLRSVRASTKGLSIEPLSERIPADMLDLTGIDWVIVGGESGRRGVASPFDLDWAVELREHCRRHGVAFFLKQLGRNPTQGGQPLAMKESHGGDWDEWTPELRVREFPQYFHMYRANEIEAGDVRPNRNNVLPHEEAKDFKRLHGLVAKHSKSLLEASKALQEIRDRRLYRADHSTFEAYCQDAHGLSRQHVNHLIKAGKTLVEMETTVVTAGAPLPSNEAQLRQLARVPDAEERCRHYLEIWDNVGEEGGCVTAAKIRAHLDGLAEQKDPGTAAARLTTKQRISQALDVIGELEGEIEQGGKVATLVARLKELFAA